MKKALLIFSLMFILTAGIAAAAADLSTYPSPFVSGSSFDAQIIVGSSAPATDTLAASEIAVALQQVSEDRITASLEDEYDSSKNSILIGLPCQNPVVASVLGTTACDFGLAEGQGYLKIVENESVTRLIVSGKTAADTRRAARALANYKENALAGTEMVISGTLDAPVARKQEPLQVKQGETAPAPVVNAGSAACSADADCADDKWCLAGTCRELGCPEGTVAKSHDCVKEVKPAATAANASKPAAETPVKVEKKGFFARIFGWFGSIFSRKKAE